jgi:signal transduction histidine kinase
LNQRILLIHHARISADSLAVGIEGGGVSERVAVHVEKVVHEALDLLQAKLPAGVTVDTSLRAGRAAILGDPTQVHQVLQNLGTNAVQAMPSGANLAVSLEVARFDTAQPATLGTVGAGEWLVL